RELMSTSPDSFSTGDGTLSLPGAAALEAVTVQFPSFAGHCTSAARSAGVRNHNGQERTVVRSRKRMKPFLLDTFRLLRVPALFNRGRRHRAAGRFERGSGYVHGHAVQILQIAGHALI